MVKLTQRGLERGRRAALRAAHDVVQSAALEESATTALADARRRVKATPRDPDAVQELARCHVRLAYLRDNLGEGELGPTAMADLRSAAEAWDRLLRLDPPDVHPRLAFSMERAFREGFLDDRDKMLRALEIALQHTDVPTAGQYERLARMYHADGRLQESEAAADRAVALMPRVMRRWMRRQLKDLD